MFGDYLGSAVKHALKIVMFFVVLYFDDDQFTPLVFDQQIHFVEFIVFIFPVGFTLQYLQNFDFLI